MLFIIHSIGCLGFTGHLLSNKTNKFTCRLWKLHCYKPQLDFHTFPGIIFLMSCNLSMFTQGT